MNVLMFRIADLHGKFNPVIELKCNDLPLVQADAEMQANAICFCVGMLCLVLFREVKCWSNLIK